MGASSCGSLSEGLFIALDAGFDIDEVSLRAATSNYRVIKYPVESDLDESELGWVVGGTSDESGGW